jgi:hypothetical protein
MSLLVLFSAPEKRTIPFGSFRKERQYRKEEKTGKKLQISNLCCIFAGGIMVCE